MPKGNRMIAGLILALSNEVSLAEVYRLRKLNNAGLLNDLYEILLERYCVMTGPMDENLTRLIFACGQATMRTPKMIEADLSSKAAR